MDRFREHWPEIDLDLVSGFHPDPLELLGDNRADLVVVSEPQPRRGIAVHPLFRFEIVGLVSRQHPLASRPYLKPEDFAEETLISYPVPEDMLDIVRKLLKPAGIEPKRRNAELTVAILQLVASRRGIAALPNWTVQSYLERDYVLAKPIGTQGLWGELYAGTTEAAAGSAYMLDFLDIVRTTSFRSLPGLLPVRDA